MGFKEYTVRVFECGNKFWYLNGELHREDGPAMESLGGDKEWYIEGVLHREDGPAVEYANGYKEWWINGGELTEKEFLSRKQGYPSKGKKDKNCDGKIVEIDGVRYQLKVVG